MTRKFKYSRDLFLRQNCRPASDQRNILPDTILREKQGKLEKMTVRQLIENGRQAVENGIASSPVGGQPIPEGFYQEAVDNPLELDGEEVRALVLRTLYDFDPANAPSEEIVGFVRERLAAAVDAHRDDTYAAFVDWFAGRKSSFVKQIAKQKKMPGGVLTNAEVNQALLALTIEAYQQMARCIDALMQAFKNSMPVPLSAQENTLFEQMYESQPYYGGFPAAFLAERMNFLKPAVLAIWNEPENEDCKHVLYRMFSYYAEMARTRREADRRSKRTDGRPQPWIENLHGEARPAEETRFDLIGDHIREVHGITCDSGCLQWGSRLVKQTEESVTIGIRCECGNSDRSLEMSIDEFTRCAECALEQTSLASSSNGIGSG